MFFQRVYGPSKPIHSEASWRERKCPDFETVSKGDSNPGSLDCESGVLLLSYGAPSVCLWLDAVCACMHDNIVFLLSTFSAKTHLSSGLAVKLKHSFTLKQLFARPS